MVMSQDDALGRIAGDRSGAAGGSEGGSKGRPEGRLTRDDPANQAADEELDEFQSPICTKRLFESGQPAPDDRGDNWAR